MLALALVLNVLASAAWAERTWDPPFDAALTLKNISSHHWKEVSEAEHVSREELKDIGVAYLNMWTDAGPRT
ncbi:hypothetical protein IMZ48_36225 [Candidatus Bathyarchaeota archaeon]|nr:hypothetical protein [Candidatus Bathyarchaeota archaeon]